MKINVLNRERFEVNPEEISVTFDDVKGVSLVMFIHVLHSVHNCGFLTGYY